jgi:hypothetical protein
MYAPMLSPRNEIIGAMPPPQGVTGNFVDPPSRAHVLIIVTIVFATLSTLFTALRFYTALSITHHVQKDDCELYVCSQAELC